MSQNTKDGEECIDISAAMAGSYMVTMDHKDNIFLPQDSLEELVIDESGVK